MTLVQAERASAEPSRQPKGSIFASTSGVHAASLTCNTRQPIHSSPRPASIFLHSPLTHSLGHRLFARSLVSPIHSFATPRAVRHTHTGTRARVRHSCTHSHGSIDINNCNICTCTPGLRQEIRNKERSADRHPSNPRSWPTTQPDINAVAYGTW